MASSSSSGPEAEAELVVGGKYRLVRRIGSGSGAGAARGVYLAVSVPDGEEVAVRLEPREARRPRLPREGGLYRVLRGGVGIPRVRWCGQERDYRALVLDRLGPSLEDLFNFCARRFTLTTVLALADQMISRLEYVHAKNVVHGDIKPDSFLLGLGRHRDTLFLVDFGSARRYRDDDDDGTGRHRPRGEDEDLAGAARSSAPLGTEQSRREDMESLGHVLMYFNRTSLPWQGLTAATKRQQCEKIREKKMSTPVEALCEGFPAEFAAYLNYCRGLRFEDAPDYAYLRQLFRVLFRTLSHRDDCASDWSA